jgi:hypothetical protein
MPRFVILEHDHPHLHWDLMLETADVLATWRLPRVPAVGTMPATRIGDHRRLYLDYEGPLSGDRGRVTRWDWGTFDELERTANRVTLTLKGQRIAGAAILEETPGGEWQLTLHPAK